MKKNYFLTVILIFISFSIYANGMNLSLETAPFNPDSVNWLDRTFMQPFNKSLNTASTIILCASVLTPAFLLSTPKSSWLDFGLMYAESMAVSFGLKELGKALFKRARPFMYYNNYPISEVNSGDWNDSFPSGHATMAFTAASFVTYAFCKFYPNSKWKIPAIVTSYTLATATAVMRVASGSHFLTDVLAGAVIGTASGILVPMIHTAIFKRPKVDVSGNISPMGIHITMKF